MADPVNKGVYESRKARSPPPSPTPKQEPEISSLLDSFKNIALDELANDKKIQSKFVDIVLNKKRNIFLSGAGGVGKSYLVVNILKTEADRRQKMIAITSTTGVSALAIGGTTIFRWSGIKLGKESVSTICTRIRQNNKDCYKRWRDCKILVIDEISMLGMKIFECLDRVGQNICDNDIPFGGKQLIVAGDFLQLPPVQDTFSFNSETWDALDFRIFRMTQPKRYPDVEHFHMLMRIRVAQHTKEDIKKLYSRCDAYIDYIRKGGDKKERIKPTRIYSLKKDVEQHNLEELSKLPGKTLVYNAIDKFVSKRDIKSEEGLPSSEGPQVKKGVDKISGKEIMEYTEFLDTIVDRQRLLKPGAQVMLTYNLDIELGLVNGSRGVVLSCDPDSVNVFFKNGMTNRISYHLYEFEDGKVKMMRYQLPLILAWGISIHKTQGATLDYCIMDLGPSIFAPGMGYVALSRVRTLDGLLLSSFEPKKIIADPYALEFERKIIEKEKDDDYDYEQEKDWAHNEDREEDIQVEGKRNGNGVNQNKEGYEEEEIPLLRGVMCGETAKIEKIPGIDKNLIAFIKIDCPEIYEIMTTEMWEKLKDLDVPIHIDNESLYNTILGLLDLECEEEDENEPGQPRSTNGPIEDLSSSDDELIVKSSTKPKYS